MNPLPILALAALIGTASVVAAETPPTASAEPTKEQLKRVTEFLQSSDSRLRSGAYKGCRARGEDFKAAYFELLERAYQHHGNQVARVIRDAVGPGSPAGELAADWKSWREISSEAAEFVLTDHEKDKTKHDQMDRLFADAEKAWARVAGAKKNAGKPGGDVAARVESSLAALREIHIEKAYCRPDEFDAEEELELADFERELSLGDDATAYLRDLATIAGTMKTLEEVHAHNEAQKWAGPAHKTFARILNTRRAVLGLQPLRLEEKLSDACAAHSKEMTALGYFAHESPVEKNRSFGQRAENAGFQGAAGGECIYSGSADAAAAEKAWWYSDGHRLINYSRDPNTLGLGPVGTMWTLNVGTYSW